MNTRGNGIPKLPGDWLGFQPDDDEAAARAAFERRYGYAPAHVIRAKVVLYAGPVLDQPGQVASWGLTDAQKSL